ncbi:MAG: aminotransferase class IV, partial [Acidobacteria bacterium]|nr:aminotransferase class IV [Acidobacteriota bacterium]
APVGAYYEGSVSLYVTRKWIRAAEGGIGEAKAAGNYSASYYGMKEAREHGCDNVLWLDSREHRFVEECGTMNMMFVIGDRVVTPPLGGTILPGITRDSAIQLLRDQMGRTVEERPVSIEEVAGAGEAGTLHECFGVGTAAVVTPVARLTGGGVEVRLPEETPLQDELRDRLTGIRLGRRPDPYGWVDRLA